MLFDPDTVNRGPSRRVFDMPGGAARLSTDAVGIHGVWVNGARVVNGDGPSAGDARPGTLLREFAS